MHIWVIGVAHPFNDELAFISEVEAEAFDDAVSEAKKSWSALVAEYEHRVGESVPDMQILTVYRKDDHPRKPIIIEHGLIKLHREEDN